MKIGLAQTKFPRSSIEGMEIVKQMITEAKSNNCDVVCFPESIIPGLRGVGFEIEEYNHSNQKNLLEEICAFAGEKAMNVILPMEWHDDLGFHLVAFVISEDGQILGYQTKNQIDPEEDVFCYVPGRQRTLFQIKNVNFGIVICHEGWRYPETVRWAARNNAAIVFHPQFTGDVDNPDFFKGAMVCRSLENNIYFASVNYALENQTVTTSLISPNGERLFEAESGKDQLIVHEIDINLSHGLLAKRFHPELF